MATHRLVFGLGAGIVYSLGKANGWREILPKFLAQFDNDILISAKDMPLTIVRTLNDIINAEERLYIDSGGFTLFKEEKKFGKESEVFKKKCESMKRKYLKMLSVIKPKECFELDNEYFRKCEDMLSPQNYLRQEIKDIVGYYPTPVFKMHQGLEYWKKLCECDMYPRLSIGGLAQTREWNKFRNELKTMMEYARANNKKVHLLGCQNIETFKIVQPETIDYNIFQLSINVVEVRKEHPEFNKNTPYYVLSPHAALWALARAKVRTYFYDSYMISSEE